MRKSITLCKIKNYYLVFLFFLASVGFAQSQCPNSDFETGTLSGWNSFTGGCCPINANTPGEVSGRHTIMSGTGTDPNTCNTVTYVAPGGLFSARLGNDNIGAEAEKLTYSLIVDASNSLFIYKYAVVLEDPGHDPSEQPRFQIRVLDALGNLIDPICGFYSVVASGSIPGFQTCNGDIRYKDWTTVGLDLSPYINNLITIEFSTGDCSLGGHYGYAYVDASCSPLQINSNFCIGSSNAILTAPEGFTYLWNTGATTQSITISNPNQNDTYSCTLTSVTGCIVTLTTQINLTQPSASFTLTNTCYSNVIFTDTSSIPSGIIIDTYLWDFGDGFTSTVQNPTHSYSSPGNYTVTYTISNSAGCSNTTSSVVTVYQEPTASISYANPSFCVSDNNSYPINISGTYLYTGGTYSSSSNDLILDTNTGTISPSNSLPGIYTVTYTIPTSNNCTVPPVTTNVSIATPPTASISYNSSPFCSSLTGSQPVNIIGTGLYSGGIFSSTIGLTIDNATGAIVPFTSTPGNYIISYSISAIAGCPAVIATTAITITASPTVNIGYATPFCSSLTGSQPVNIIGTGLYSGGIFSTTIGLTIDNATGAIMPSTSIPGIYTISYSISASGGCPAVIATTSATILSLPQINSINPLYYCDPNNDGFGVFDLTQVIPTLIGGVAYPVSFHETLTDAQIHGTTIPIPSNYFNIHVDQQTIYVRVESLTSNSCFMVIPLDLIVNPTPQAEPADYHVCDDNYDGFATFDLTSKTPEVLGTINPVTNSINYYTSLADAQSSSNPIINLTNFINTTINTQTLWIRVETIATGCFDIVTLQLVVDPLPNATQPNYPPYTLCDNDQTNLGFETFDLGSKINGVLLGQNGMSVNFYFSQADALSNSNPLPLLYVNSAIYVQTLWIRIENVFTGCFVLSTMDIRIEPLPSPIPPSPYTVCDSNQDGFSSFDLNTLTSDILQGANYTITYHETLTDAQLGSNSLVSPYDNLIPFIQFIYASALDNVNGCRSVIPIELNVEPKPKMPTNIPPIVQCDEDNNSQDFTMLFDLTQITPIVLAVQDMASSNYTVTYYVSEADAIAGLSPIIQSTAFTGTNNQIIWLRVENNASHCFAIGSFMLSINRPLLLTTPLPLSICDNDASPNNLYTVFDLTVRNNVITQGQPNMTVTYYPSYPVTASSIAIANPTSYTNVAPAVQTLGVMVTNAQGCRSYTSLDIRVLPIPTPRTTGINPLPAKCDDNLPGDMLEVFDLTTNAAYIINGDPNVTLHYFATLADAAANLNELIPATAALVGTNVWIRVENNRVDYLGNRCFVLVEQPLTVNPLPTVVTPLAPYRACDNNADGFTLFNLADPLLAPQILGTLQLPDDYSNYSISYYATAAGANPITNTGETALPNSYTNVTPNAETIYIRVVNNTTGCVNTGALPLAVEPYATATGPQTFNQCDSYADPYDGVELIDLTTYAPAILNGQNPAVFIVSYYTSLADAQAGNNALTLAEAQAYETDANTDTIWVKVENSSNLITPFCNAITTIALTIEPLPEPIISSPTNNICVDYATNVLLSGLTLNSGLTTPNYTFVWSLGGTVIPGATASTYDITTVAPGDYTVVATSTSSLACVSNVSNTFTVIQSGPAQFSVPAYTVSNPFEDNQVIVVNVVGFGQYEFSLDDGPFQINNVFENVSLGSHTITIKDVKGNTSCGEIVIDDIQTVNYPHYFTPNGDGIHDTWNVVGLENEPRAKLYIFDRYGKLLKQLSTTSKGWDGTYNGYLLPSTDYWFKIEFPNLKSEWKEFKSHFSLKR